MATRGYQRMESIVRSRDTSIVVNRASTKSWLLSTKGTSLLGEMADSRTWAEKVQDEPETSCIRKQGREPKEVWKHVKEIQSLLKTDSLVKLGKV